MRIALLAALTAAALAAPAFAKLPPPSDEAKAKAAEAAAKTAHGGKVAAFKLCQTQDKVAARYVAASAKAGKPVKPVATTPACVDPGPFGAAPAPAKKS